MIKNIYILLTFILLTSITGVAYAAPPAQTQNQQGLLEVAREAGHFTTFVQTLDAANLSDTLANEGPFTIFAPTDEAFAALPAGALDDLFANPEALRNVLSYHVVEGRIAATDLMNMATVSTLQGAVSEVLVDGETVMIGGAQVLDQGIEASNGVIYTIDTVLLPPGAMTETEPGMIDSATRQDGAEMVENPTPAECAEAYVVQADDSLSQLADKFYGDPQAFATIVETTNTVATTNEIYARIDNPDLILVGQTLCIPGAPGVEAAGGVTPTDNEAMLSDEAMMTVPEDKSLVIVENLSSVDLIVDLSGPTRDSQVVPPAAKQEFIVEPGQYQYDGHQPGGGFAVAPGQFELTSEQTVQLICYDDEQCQVQPLNRP
jgi:uncharacterized surface protein with fasciclin (FAS1) repeats